MTRQERIKAWRKNMRHVKITPLFTEEPETFTGVGIDYGEYKCLKCGDCFKLSHYKALYGKGCIKCTRKRVARLSSLRNRGITPGNAITPKAWKDMILEKRGARILSKNVYTALTLQCLTCKYVQHNVLRHNAIRFGCPKCAGTVKKTTKDHASEIKKLYKTIELISEYTGAFQYCTYRCKTCRFTWPYLPTNALKPNKMKCPSCSHTPLKTRVVNNRSFKLRGYEKYGLDYLLRKHKPAEINAQLSHDVPTIRLRNKRRHFPDFFIPSTNTLVEVKSLWTMGLAQQIEECNERLFDLLCEKRSRAREKGYRYQVLVFNDHGERLPLPTGWYSMSVKKLQRECETLGYL